jgi:hypothetical protein
MIFPGELKVRLRFIQPLVLVLIEFHLNLGSMMRSSFQSQVAKLFRKGQIEQKQKVEEMIITFL